MKKKVKRKTKDEILVARNKEKLAVERKLKKDSYIIQMILKNHLMFI